jgi:hypothetical protein
MLTDDQQNQLKDIFRLIPPDEQAAFLDMLTRDLRGRDLDRGELRRVAEHIRATSPGPCIGQPC